MVYEMIKHRNMPVRPTRQLKCKKNGLKKYVQSSLKSHLLWIFLYLELAVVSHIAETLKETDQSET